MISLILFFCAAIFNAIADTLENEHFFTSVFKGWNQSFWYKRESYKTAKKIFGWKLDGWHLAKSGWVLCVIGAVVTCRWPFIRWQDYIFFVLVYGAVWNAGFDLFYKILTRK